MQVSFSLQKSLFYVKRYEGRDRRARDREFWYTSSKFYNDIAYYVYFSETYWNSPTYIFSDPLKVLVTLLYLIFKKVIFSKCLDFRLQYLFLLFVKLMQHVLFDVY